MSEAALDLLKRIAAGESVLVTDETRPIRELVEAGLMIRAHSFTGGWYYAPSKRGWEWLELVKRAC